MQSFVVVSGPAAAMPAANVDTDVIMPKQYLKGVDRSGLVEGVFRPLRFDEAGRERPDFVLNQTPWRKAAFLVVGPNFGCGSSREHAVWGLLQLGVRGLIGVSFAGIFFDNCSNNGLLAVTVSLDEHARLMALAADPATCGFTIDLLAQTVTAGDGFEADFEVDAMRKHGLLEGLDAVGRTLEVREDILAFETVHHAESPWLV